MIPLIKKTFYREKQVKAELTQFIKSAKILSFGKECQKFEDQFSEYQGRKFTLMMNSGSSANLAIIQSLLNLGLIKQHDLVGFSAVTWSTNVMPLIQLGLNPVPIDVEIDTLNMGVAELERVYKKYPIKLLFLTHLLGLCGDLEEIVLFCKKKNIILIEDTCESLGSLYQGKKLGNFGLASTFSFYVGHHLSTIEGGAVATDSKRLAEMLSIVRAHGWDRNMSIDGQKRFRDEHKVNSTFYSRYTFYDLGFNFRATEIAGFLGQIALKGVEEIVTKRENNFLTFAGLVYPLADQYYPLAYAHMDRVSSFALPLICRSPQLRKKLVMRCDNRIEVRPIVGGSIPNQPFYKKYLENMNLKLIKLEKAELIHKQGLYMGNNPDLTKKELGLMIKTVTNKQQ